VEPTRACRVPRTAVPARASFFPKSLVRDDSLTSDHESTTRPLSFSHSITVGHYIPLDRHLDLQLSYRSTKHPGGAKSRFYGLLVRTCIVDISVGRAHKPQNRTAI
jgi:hypothetical protein